MTDAPAATIETHASIAEIGRKDWDQLANPEGEPYNPFIAFDFLDVMERSGSARAETGWQPAHLTLKTGGELRGVMPAYLKGHSQGEYLFDHAFADAWARAGGRYYPKLLSAVPFTPATGRRVLAPSTEDRRLLLAGYAQLAERMGVSGANINFLSEEEGALAESLGYALRFGEQFHFEDEGFGDWEGFLAALSSRKRKDLRKERASVAESDLTIEWITGSDIEERHLDAFWWFYQDTGARKWGSPYLTRSAFEMLAERLADRLLFILARRGEEYVAGAMNMIGGDTLYGRYWGCTEHIPFLHFELCYYQAIDYALAHGLTRVEAGAQGEHKVARGYKPVAVRSVHKMTDPRFHEAVADYVEREREAVGQEIAFMAEHTPFRKTP
ncbi:GNAT family N-acetyltransferase [Parvularcula maris]|uniref:GNAT family N-acetyltransferase n=1 Tax=Parvularcula maris TaxID=2965077 RepID=A0A9X2RI82_9PROT|nr:GNAT family N-acetyltransferase [Parvularcula maris]MCQ8185699.1 GNAT family N-acetyltransferase [Parvularcula maris]